MLAECPDLGVVIARVIRGSQTKKGLSAASSLKNFVQLGRCISVGERIASLDVGSDGGGFSEILAVGLV